MNAYSVLRLHHQPFVEGGTVWGIVNPREGKHPRDDISVAAFRPVVTVPFHVEVELSLVAIGGERSASSGAGGGESLALGTLIPNAMIV